MLSDRVASQEILTPGDYFLEARIKRVSTNSWVSTGNRSYNHNLEYSVPQSQIQYQRAEQDFSAGLSNPDDYFDPGEILIIPLAVTDPDNGLLSEAMLSTGFVLDRNGNQQIDNESTDLFITNPNQPNPGGINIQIDQPFAAAKMSQETFNLPYLLLSAPERRDLWFFVDSRHIGENGTASTYRRYISLFELATGINGQAAESVRAVITDPDNVFGVDLTKLAFDGCLEIPGLVFDSLPVAIGDLTFDWFQNLDDLHSGAFIVGGSQVPFDPITDDELYFVRIGFEHPTQQTITQRIFPLSVTNASNCPDCMTLGEALQQVLQDAAGNWPQSRSILDFTLTLNQACPVF